MSEISIPAPAQPFFRFIADPLRGLETPPQFVELLPVAIYACDRSGRILWFNQKAVELWGRAPGAGATGDRYGGYWKSYVNGREVSRESSHMAKVLRSGAAIHGLESVLERQDGSRIWVMMHIDPVRDDSGNIVGAINCFHDITANKKNEQTLREQDQRLAATYEHANVGIGEVDRDGTLLRVNQTACAITGRSREQLLGQNIFDWRRSEQHEKDRDRFRQLIAGKIDRYAIEKRYQRGDGSAMWMHVITSAVREETGKFLYAVRVFQDVTEAKRAIDALAENEQRLAASYEHAAIGITEVDVDGVRLRANRAACTIMASTREQMIGARVFDVTHPDDRDDDLARHRRLVSGEIDRYTMEKRYFAGDGAMKWLSVACSAVRDETGKFRYSVRVFHDVTEVKRTIEALADSQRRLAATYEHAAIAISEVDAEGRLRRVNETVCAITGYGREELFARTVFDITHPDDRAEDRETFRSQTDEQPAPYAVEKRLICKDGRIIWVSVASSTVCDADGRFRYGIRVMQDITARKRAEEKVRESEQQLRQLLEALPAAVYTTDAAGRITFYNQAAVELSGRVPKLNSDEWCVTWKLYYPDGRPMRHEDCPMAVALRDDHAVRGCEAVAERPDGARVPFMPYPTPLHDSSNTLVGAVNMLVDITDRKRAEERQKALIDELNHRVKNTLATVQSLATQTLRDSGDLADIFMSRLFALSRTHDQLSRAGWESADFKSIVDDVLAPYRMDSERRVSIEGGSVRLPPNCALLLAMVIHELSTNAAKYGSLSVLDGMLKLSWTVQRRLTDHVLHIEWTESGGPPVRRPKRRGFGSRLADRAITRELGGAADIDFDPSGLRCKFVIPLANLHA